MTDTETKVPFADKFRRFWTTLTRPQAAAPQTEESKSPPQLSSPPDQFKEPSLVSVRQNKAAHVPHGAGPNPVGLVSPSTTMSTDTGTLFARVLEFSQERKGKNEPPRFEGRLEKEYRTVVSTVTDADQKFDGDENALLLFCFVQTNVQDVVFFWLKDNCEIYPSSRIRILSQPRATLLRINYPQLTDSGLYCCVAANPEGRCETMSRVVVTDPAVSELTDLQSPSADSVASDCGSDVTDRRKRFSMSRFSRSSSLLVSDSRRSKRVRHGDSLIDQLRQLASGGTDDSRHKQCPVRSPLASPTLPPDSQMTSPTTGIPKSAKSGHPGSSSSSPVDTPDEENYEDAGIVISNSDSESQTDILALPECDQPVTHSAVLKRTNSMPVRFPQHIRSNLKSARRPIDVSAHAVRKKRINQKSLKKRNRPNTVMVDKIRRQPGDQPQSNLVASRTGKDDLLADDLTEDDSEHFSTRRKTVEFASVRDKPSKPLDCQATHLGLNKGTTQPPNATTQFAVDGSLSVIQKEVKRPGTVSVNKVGSPVETVQISPVKTNRPNLVFVSNTVINLGSPKHRTPTEQKLARIKSPRTKNARPTGKTMHDSALSIVHNHSSDDDDDDDTGAFTFRLDRERDSFDLTPIPKTRNPKTSTLEPSQHISNIQLNDPSRIHASTMDDKSADDMTASLNSDTSDADLNVDRVLGLHKGTGENVIEKDTKLTADTELKNDERADFELSSVDHRTDSSKVSILQETLSLRSHPAKEESTPMNLNTSHSLLSVTETKSTNSLANSSQADTSDADLNADEVSRPDKKLVENEIKQDGKENNHANVENTGHSYCEIPSMDRGTDSPNSGVEDKSIPLCSHPETVKPTPVKPQSPKIPVQKDWVKRLANFFQRRSNETKILSKTQSSSMSTLTVNRDSVPSTDEQGRRATYGFSRLTTTSSLTPAPAPTRTTTTTTTKTVITNETVISDETKVSIEDYRGFSRGSETAMVSKTMSLDRPFQPYRNSIGSVNRPHQVTNRVGITSGYVKQTVRQLEQQMTPPSTPIAPEMSPRKTVVMPQSPAPASVVAVKFNSNNNQCNISDSIKNDQWNNINIRNNKNNDNDNNNNSGNDSNKNSNTGSNSNNDKNSINIAKQNGKSSGAQTVTRRSFIDLPAAVENPKNNVVTSGLSNRDHGAVADVNKSSTVKPSSQRTTTKVHIDENSAEVKPIVITKRPKLAPSLLHSVEGEKRADRHKAEILGADRMLNKSQVSSIEEKKKNKEITICAPIDAKRATIATNPSGSPSRKCAKSVSSKKEIVKPVESVDKNLSLSNETDKAKLDTIRFTATATNTTANSIIFTNSDTPTPTIITQEIITPVTSNKSTNHCTSIPIESSSIPSHRSSSTLSTTLVTKSNAVTSKDTSSESGPISKSLTNPENKSTVPLTEEQKVHNEVKPETQTTPVQLLPVAKLMETCEREQARRETLEQLRASLLQCPRSPLLEDSEETDDEGSNRVEYPSKVKTARGVDPSTHFEIVGILGRGKFGQVVTCKEKTSGKMFASKTFRTTRLSRHNGELMEVAVLRAVGKHPQIAFMHAAYENGTQCTIVTELVSGGALYKRIQEEGTLDEAITVGIIRQVLLGLRHLQTCQVIHCDLKPENLVMRKPRGYELKIIDFGLACFYKPPRTRRRSNGPPYQRKHLNVRCRRKHRTMIHSRMPPIYGVWL
ncbi:Serine:threonine protein kinase [Fasciola gigantica]|uniref:Serine:threonine protein kinase n=1 Tax=Fasciola gigantica TaxID=46835 RepID=A0A504YXF2_FASGI|nr:Serine:threonine protein kinase [Fasciola gigantica]